MQTRRTIMSAAAGLALGIGRAANAQSGFPAKPVRLVVAYPAGGPLDVIARILAEPLGQALGQPVVVDNRSGAGGVIGSDAVARAAPDGLTLLLGSTPLCIQDSLGPKPPYSILRDFAPVAKIGEGPQVLVVGSGLPVRNMHDFIAYAKAQDGKLNYASPSTGGSNHLAAELLKRMAGFEATHIPYKGGAPAEVDLIGGQVAFMFGALTSSMRQVERGRLRALGVTSAKRWPTFPDLPAIAEVLPGYEIVSWYGVLAPSGTSNAIVKRLNSEINRILDDPEMQKRLIGLDLLVEPGTPVQFAQYIRQNRDMWAKVVKEANVTVE